MNLVLLRELTARPKLAYKALSAGKILTGVIAVDQKSVQHTTNAIIVREYILPV